MFRPLYTNFPFYLNKHGFPRKYYLHESINNKNLVSNNISPFENKTQASVCDVYKNDQKNKSNISSENCLFDLFGLKIYFDDILLVSLLYFLYSEGVKDDSLFIVLILLLLS